MTDEPLSWIEVEINPLDERNFDPNEQPPPPPGQGKTAEDLEAERGSVIIEDRHGRPLKVVHVRRRPKDK